MQRLHAQAGHGSSPQARGTRRCPRPALCSAVYRFIPAGAGNTLTHTRFRIAAVTAVHPRRRGEHCRTCDPCAGAMRRFIPAGAGNTSIVPRTSVQCSAGSSPQARGTLIEHCPAKATVNRRLNRFIPAGAGNTMALAVWGHGDDVAVHPRRRGEHRILDRQSPIPESNGSSPQARGTPPVRMVGFLWIYGSSPQARGTRVITIFSHPAGTSLRFIPAGAGNTESRRIRRRSAMINGSSPQARGTLQFPSRFCRRRRRFIPAGAGNT